MHNDETETLRVKAVKITTGMWFIFISARLPCRIWRPGLPRRIFYAKPRSEIFELETQLKTARDRVAHLYARWQELELLQSVPSP